ncbi:MAG: type II toxin-antitoxin system VapC family toxin [Deferribacteres bacterium]|nr:type II toxin-antitoxin system VapC family toxin [Deferribacteres bacterium]
MKKKGLLDSYALLAYLKREKGYEKVKSLLSSDDTLMLINDINLGETFYILARERGIEQAEYFMDVIFPSLPIKNITNTLIDVLEAARIKSEYSISYADCFAAATAMREDASIVTGDPEFKKLGEKVSMVWI